MSKFIYTPSAKSATAYQTGPYGSAYGAPAPRREPTSNFNHSANLENDDRMYAESLQAAERAKHAPSRPVAPISSYSQQQQYSPYSSSSSSSLSVASIAAGLLAADIKEATAIVKIFTAPVAVQTSARGAVDVQLAAELFQVEPALSKVASVPYAAPALAKVASLPRAAAPALAKVASLPQAAAPALTKVASLSQTVAPALAKVASLSQTVAPALAKVASLPQAAAPAKVAAAALPKPSDPDPYTDSDTDSDTDTEDVENAEDAEDAEEIDDGEVVEFVFSPQDIEIAIQDSIAHELLLEEDGFAQQGIKCFLGHFRNSLRAVINGAHSARSPRHVANINRKYDQYRANAAIAAFLSDRPIDRSEIEFDIHDAREAAIAHSVFIC